jgi:hypothetical protein
VYDIRARAFAQFEEVEDEGACYAFELEGDRLVFITGQEFYEGARFPSLGFSLVYVLDERERTVDMFVDKRGAKTAPAKTISAASKQALDIPEHLEVRSGRIDMGISLIRPAHPACNGNWPSRCLGVLDVLGVSIPRNDAADNPLRFSAPSC